MPESLSNRTPLAGGRILVTIGRSGRDLTSSVKSNMKNGSMRRLGIIDPAKMFRPLFVKETAAPIEAVFPLQLIHSQTPYFSSSPPFPSPSLLCSHTPY